MPVYALGDLVPDIDAEAFVHPDAVVIGNVSVGREATIWPGAVLRGDYGRIEVGARTSVQDGTVVHATGELVTVIGSECVIGHLAHLEGCTIESFALVGSGSVVLHRAVVRSFGVVGANAVVTNGMEVPEGAMALGVPAIVKEGAVSEASRRFVRGAVELYAGNGRRYREQLRLA